MVADVQVKRYNKNGELIVDDLAPVSPVAYGAMQ